MRLLVVTAFVWAGLALIIPPQAQADNDWECWNTYELSDSVNERLDIKAATELRYNNDMSEHYYTHMEIGLDWKVSDWFVLGPYYRH